VYIIHLGYNNDFLIQTDHELALIYNNNAPLENYHCANVFVIVKYYNKENVVDKEFNFLDYGKDCL
jgi:transposase